MKKQKIIEIAVKVIVSTLTAFLTAIGTTSRMGVWTVLSYRLTQIVTEEAIITKRAGAESCQPLPF